MHALDPYVSANVYMRIYVPNQISHFLMNQLTLNQHLIYMVLPRVLAVVSYPAVKNIMPWASI